MGNDGTALRPPAAVARLAAGRTTRAVWANEVGGLTFEVGHGPERFFVKWTPAERAWELEAEGERLRWAAAFTPVPAVIEEGHDHTGAWLATTALPGENAVSSRWTAEPAVAVRAIGDGLRALHDAVPVRACPFSWSAGGRLADARRRVSAGELDPAGWHPIHRHLSVEDALALAEDIPSTDLLVACHGDACAPNTLLTGDGRWSGHVDLGSLGVADRWADLAVATWSTEWNYGPGWEELLLDVYGVDADHERMAYYRLLWDLGP